MPDERLDGKLELYRNFWDMKPVSRPMVGFDVGGWFPFQRYADLRNIQEKGFIEPEMLDARRCLPDYDAFMARCLEVDDDFIKGVCPVSAIPWMEGMLGCALQRSGQSVWAVERMASWEELSGLALSAESADNPWFRKYIEFVRVLTERAGGRYPVGLPILRGVTDVMGALRGHTEAIIGLMEDPAEATAFAGRAAEVLIALTKAHHAATVPFRGEHFIEAYSMWAPGPLVRMQEDATAVYSPDLYRNIVLEADRRIARAFPYSIIHLHSSSLFLLDDFLSIKEIGVFQVNRDVGEMGLPDLIPYLKRIQEEGRRIFLRGPLDKDDFELVAKNLSPIGLMVQSVVGSAEEARALSTEAARIFGARK
ncbi:MAG TPA: hypothetical protein DIC34_18135 [Treponema sp.]|nr:MAG: hypothetical protein A2Y36_02775 [Treponema sp. GWA1_62_8]OHE70198.1 MAG: hypothetical protein A2001_06945 [Treponema sp. GWC1_61_84]OHE71952.1 MAG: hypothetical protein A2413_00630 [Treponema sp. RIFOXYC1_FULL_61_9]HCM28421.1 hypothetical protein [Treponema sp.]